MAVFICRSCFLFFFLCLAPIREREGRIGKKGRALVEKTRERERLGSRWFLVATRTRLKKKLCFFKPNARTIPTLIPPLLAFCSCIRTLSTSVGWEMRRREKEREVGMSERGRKEKAVVVAEAINRRTRCDQNFLVSPSGMVQVLATLTEAPDNAIWRRTGVEAAGDVAAILSGVCPREVFSREREGGREREREEKR